MKFIKVDKYQEVTCISCEEDDWGTFIELPSGYKICKDCFDSIIIETEVETLRNKLKTKLKEIDSH